MKASGKLKSSRSSLREEDLKTPSRVNVDKVISEIRTLRSRLSEITPVSSPSIKRKSTHFAESFDDSDRELPSNRDPFRVGSSITIFNVSGS
jgi:pyrimidine operon attenuation protein/uracil phosphoribosyltransferase